MVGNKKQTKYKVEIPLIEIATRILVKKNIIWRRK